MGLQTIESRNRVVRVRNYGGPEELEVADTPVPEVGPGEVRVRVLASSIVYTDAVIRRHLYPATLRMKPPYIPGYDVVGEIDRIGSSVAGFNIGDRVADMTVTGSNATYRNLPAKDLTRVPHDVDAAEAAALILSWTTAYQMLHRVAQVRRGQRVLVQGAAGAVGQALVTLGRMAGLQVWGTAKRAHADLTRKLGAIFIDYEREDFTKVLPGGFDAIFDGVGAGGYARSFSALRRGGLLCAYGYTASVQSRRPIWTILRQLLGAQLWGLLFGWIPGVRRSRVYSINVMRSRHPDWFKEDLGRLFELLAAGAIHPNIAKRIGFAEVAEAHRRLEEGSLRGRLVLCP